MGYWKYTTLYSKDLVGSASIQNWHPKHAHSPLSSDSKEKQESKPEGQGTSVKEKRESCCQRLLIACSFPVDLYPCCITTFACNNHTANKFYPIQSNAIAAKILWDFSHISTDHHYTRNHQLFDYQKKQIYFMEISCPADINVVLKEEEKLLKYRGLAAEFQ